MIKVMHTSKSGVIVNINNTFGKLIDGQFVPYTEDQLKNKTAYKNEYGWEEYSSIEEYITARTLFNEKRKKENAEFELKIAEKRKNENEKLQNLIAAGTIPTTIDNLKLVLKYLNDQNWGGWDLPKMSIGYSANQYDCDGSTATTITLNQPISDSEYGIENETKFKTGGKRGHLSKYRSI